MSEASFVPEYLAHFEEVLRAEGLSQRLADAQAAVLATREAGRKLIFAGNGASASLASHYALDFTKQAGVPSLAFNDAALITAYANDYGYEMWVARAIEHHAEPGDLAVLISSSGASPNMLHAAERCGELGVSVVSFTGFESDNPLRARSDLAFWAASRAYNVVEAVHAAWLGMLCDLIIGAREYGVKG